ncbi:MAG: MFS transporter [Rhodospirillales bacterium]|nr:MFS transporter [Rhodospirillales bacterium]
MKRGHRGTLSAIVLARTAFGLQVQTVATLGPALRHAFALDFAGFGTLVGLYMLPGVALALPVAFAGRRLGDRNALALGMALMTLGSALSAAAPGVFLFGAGRLLSGSGAVAILVFQGKVLSERYTGRGFSLATSLQTGAFPIGVGLAPLVLGPLAAAYGWRSALVAGAVVAGIPVFLLLTTWREVAAVPAYGVRLLAWPSRREVRLVILAGLVWVFYNAGFNNYLAFMPALMAARHLGGAVAASVVPLATWPNLAFILAGAAVAHRLGNTPVFFAGTLCTLAAIVWAVAGGPLPATALLFGTLGAVHGGIIVATGTLATRPENRGVGMAIFYMVYYAGGFVFPAICGHAADLAGGPQGAFVAAAGLSLFAIPAWLLIR